MAHHICMRTALAEVPTNVLTRKSCFKCLKKLSMAHLALYNCEMVSAVQDISLVAKIRYWSLCSSYTRTKRSVWGLLIL